MPGKMLYIFSSVLLLALMGGCGSDSSDDDDNSNSTFGGNSNPNSCGTVEKIESNDTITGILEEKDCITEDVYPDFSGGDFSFLDEYQITLTATGILTITMESDDLDSFLYLVDREGSCSGGCSTAIEIDTDSNSAGGKDAFITMDLAAGTYGIQASSIGPSSGRYTLTTTFTP